MTDGGYTMAEAWNLQLQAAAGRKDALLLRAREAVHRDGCRTVPRGAGCSELCRAISAELEPPAPDPEVGRLLASEG
jgi:hypothetical protein